MATKRPGVKADRFLVGKTAIHVETDCDVVIRLAMDLGDSHATAELQPDLAVDIAKGLLRASSRVNRAAAMREMAQAWHTEPMLGSEQGSDR